MSKKYRQLMYNNYAHGFQGSTSSFDVAAAETWGKAYDYYFRHWLPNRKNTAIADLGCGSGNLLHFFKQKGYSDIYGVDISPEQVQLAKQVTTSVKEGNLLEYLESNSNKFDLITGLDIIEHLTKDECLRFLSLAHAALRPGGRLILQTPNAESIAGNKVLHSDLTHENCFSPALLLRLLALSGYKATEIREQGPIPRNYSLSSSARYILWQAIRTILKGYNLVETGNPGSGVFTRVFLATGIK